MFSSSCKPESAFRESLLERALANVNRMKSKAGELFFPLFVYTFLSGEVETCHSLSSFCFSDADLIDVRFLRLAEVSFRLQLLPIRG